MGGTMRKVRVFTNAELLLLKIQLRTLLQQALLSLAGLLLAVVAAAMVDVALYLFLAEYMQGYAAALIVAALNAILAIGLLVAASKTQPGAETAIVEDVRDLASEQIEADIDAVRRDFDRLSADVQRIRTGFTQAFKLIGRR
jgi:hypothetical protein